MSKVSKYLLIYSMLYVPGYFFFLIGLDLSSVYAKGANLFYVLGFHIFIAVLLCFLVRLGFASNQKISSSSYSTKIHNRISATKKILKFESILVWLYFFLACLVPILGLNNYRHASSFSENMALILALEILRTILIAFIVIKTCDPYGYKYSKNRNFLLFLLVISTIIGSTGSFSVIQVTVIAGASVLLRSKLSFGRLFLISSFGSIALVVAIVIGFANKFSFDQDIVYDLFFNDLTYVITYLGWRVGTMANATSVWLINTESLPILQTIANESIYRLSSIIGSTGEPLDIRSLARINYLEIFVDNSHPRSGTSPGLFGSYASTLPNNLSAVCLLTLVTVLLLKFFIKYLRSTNGWLPVIIMVAATYQYFDSPLDMLITPHPSQISLLIFIAIIYLPRLRLAPLKNKKFET